MTVTGALALAAGLLAAGLAFVWAIGWAVTAPVRSKYDPHRCGNCPCSLDELLDEIMRDVDPDLLPTRD
jgi:hypothetical protein